MKINELIQDFTIQASNEEKAILSKLQEVKRLDHFVRPLGKEKTPETSYREMNTNLRFAVERSLMQIDSYGQHVYDWTHRRIS